ncbi:hypothetical protein X970_19600 [Pseudomonas monteilii SB3101]|uniref:Uncharacterized protein n=1 Tax=Pseudomonas monteilii SB3101 TaxID=1435058 RepID=V9V6M4_9PSED|nr:hypothetical protein X969_19965 [Pseudomonas monteilii SB3078]AHC91169.1 hypothetical protein X970_19600 [Pseudomonas monteilii SB3101]
MKDHATQSLIDQIRTGVRVLPDLFCGLKLHMHVSYVSIGMNTVLT